jgi:toxin ParE1/3/4
MARVAIRFTESAVAGLEAVHAWYGEQGMPEVGKRIVRELVRHIERLRDHAEMGGIVPEFEEPSLRELIHPPFRIVYRREPRLVHIVRVWRGERHLTLPDDERT